MLSDKMAEVIYLRLNKIDSNALYGSVLYLGMGRSFIPNLQSPNVTDTTIVEYDQSVIDYNVASGLIKDDWKVVYMDASEFTTDNKYDFIFIDLWYDPIPKSLLNSYVDKYQPYLKPTGKILYLKTVIST